jgi:hypothetical protein
MHKFARALLPKLRLLKRDGIAYLKGVLGPM